MAQKNLVVIHLESLSNEILIEEYDNLPNVRKLMAESASLRHFFSSATSSILALSDFLYGNHYELDHSTSFDDLHSPQPKQTNLFDILADNGYRTMGIGYPVIWRDDVNKYHIWSQKVREYQWRSEYEVFVRDIEEFISDDSSPFALHVWDLRGHLAYTDSFKSKGTNFFERRSRGYSGIDETVRRVMNMLESKGQLQNTLIVGYGDHGDDLWTHSLSNGFCHATEPHTNLVWTPAFIYDPQAKPVNGDSLASLIDLRQTILHLLNISDPSAYPLSGINLLSNKNTYVFCRNFFGNQKQEKSGLIRAYGIHNEYYNLVVSCFGLEMYAYKIDRTNHSNLLSFFDFDDAGNLVFHNRGATHAHFKNIMRPDQVEHIKRHFYEMRDILRHHVEVKNGTLNTEIKNTFDMSHFTKIRERNYLWSL